jgi:hypothetical protein
VKVRKVAHLWAVKQHTQFVGGKRTGITLYPTRDAAREWARQLKADRPDMWIAPFTFVKVRIEEVTDANKG